MDTRAPLSPRRVADTTIVARELPTRHLRGKFVPVDWANPPKFDALDAAVRLSRRQHRARAMRAAPVPKGVITLFQILSKSDEPTALAVHRLKRDPASIRSITARYIDEVLLTNDPDHYRVLGVPRDAPQEQVDAHLRAALAWLLPYVGTSRWEDECASAVVAAGRAIGTADDRIAYDLASWSDMAAASSVPGHRRPGWRRPLMFGVVAISWFGLIDGYFVATRAVEPTTVVQPPLTSASTEADSSLEDVRANVVMGLEASSTATGAPIDLLNGDVAAATQTPPDFKTAFSREGAPPRSDAGVAPTVAAESQSPLPASDVPPSATGNVTAVTAREPSADPVLTASRTENAAEASVAPTADVTAQMMPTAPPAEPVVNAVKVAVLPPEPQAPAVAVAPTATVVASPSFKCSGAHTDAELAICDDPILAAKDRELARIFRQTRASLAGSLRASATNLQRNWLKDRNSCSGSKTCILSAYDSRISQLMVQSE